MLEAQAAQAPTFGAAAQPVNLVNTTPMPVHNLQRQNLQVDHAVSNLPPYARFINYLAGYSPTARKVMFTAFRGVTMLAAQKALGASSYSGAVVSDAHVQQQEAILDAAIESFRPTVTAQAMVTSQAATTLPTTSTSTSWFSPIFNGMVQLAGQAQALGKSGLRA